jgi:hypothetical protein
VTVKAVVGILVKKFVVWPHRLLVLFTDRVAFGGCVGDFPEFPVRLVFDIAVASDVGACFYMLIVLEAHCNVIAKRIFLVSPIDDCSIVEIRPVEKLKV